MAVISLGFYNPETGAHIGTLDDSQLIAVELRPALYELGAIKLTVSRHLAEASTAVLRKGNIVAVTIPEIQATPFCGFILKDDAADLISRNEQGGEHLTLSGPGLLEVLRGARLLEETYAPVPPASAERGSSTVDGVWRWASQPYGAIFTRSIEEGQNQPGTPLALVDITFDRGDDSDNVDWYEIGQDYQLATGTDLLTVSDTLAQAGDFYVIATPIVTGSNLRIRLDAHQEYGVDRSGAFGAGTVRFEKGVNLLTDLKRESRQTRITHLLTRDMDGVYTEHVTSQPYDEARWGYLDVPQTNDPALVAKIAATALAATDEESEEYSFEAAPGSTPASGLYLPFKHYRPGDYVTLHTGTVEHDLNANKQRVIGVRIVLDTAADDGTATRAHRSLRIVPELSFRNTRGLAGNNPAIQSNGGTPGCCLRLCGPTTEGTEPDEFVNWTWNETEGATGFGNHWQTVSAYELASGTQDGFVHNNGLNNTQANFRSGTSGSNIPIAPGGNRHLPCQEGVPISFSAQVGSRITSASQVTLGIIWTNTAGTQIGSTSLFDDTIGGFQNVAAVLNPPTGATMWRIAIRGRIDNIRASTGTGTETQNPHAGTSSQAARCDHTHPTTDHNHDDDYADEQHGHRADEVNIDDADDHFTGTTVEEALAELAVGGGGGAHASTHEDGGADELEVSNLATSETDTAKVLKPDGSGGVVWGTDATGGGGGGSSYLGKVIRAWPGSPSTSAGSFAGSSNAYAVPINIPGPMRLRALQVRVSSTTTGTDEWGLFRTDGSLASATKVAGGSGVLGAAGWRRIAASGGPVDVDPGTYILILDRPSSGAGQLGGSSGITTGNLHEWKQHASWTWDDTPDLTDAGWVAYDNFLSLFLVGDIDGSGTQW